MSLQSIQNDIAGRYYELADRAVTPDQIKALQQHVAQSIQNGNLAAYKGIPLVQSLTEKLNSISEAGALKSGLIQPQPLAPKVLAQVQQQAPQGIDSAESNLPQNYAGGGIVAFAGEGPSLVKSQPAMESFEDPSSGEVYQRPVPTTGGGILGAISDWADQLKAKAQGTYKTPPPAPVAPETPVDTLKKDTGIIIHDDKKGSKGAPAASTTSTPSTSGGITDYLADLRESNKSNLADLKALIMGDSAGRKKELEQNLWMSLMKGGLEMMGGQSPYAAVNIGKGGASAVEGAAQAMQQDRAEKARQVQQLVALGLKGSELQTELAKLGITKDYYEKHGKLFEAQAGYYRAGGGKGGSSAGKGSVPGAVVQSELNTMEAYKANPTQAPFFKSLPPDVQMAITKTGTDTGSYRRAMGVFNDALNQYTRNRLATIQSYGVKQQALGSGIVD